MSPETAFTLGQAILASTVAVGLIATLRKPLRYGVGTRAAYWIWLLVPASVLVILLPVASKPFHESTALLSPPVRAAVSGALRAMNQASVSTDWVMGAMAVWAGGILLAMALVVRRHLAFVRSLGAMTPLPDGSFRAAGCVDPVLLGVLRPRLVLPANFDSHYDKDERALILAHEMAHLGRWDAQINALATVWLCFSWFNPLMYWAAHWFRFDQELACDATVLATPGTTPRRYANALFKTQLATDVTKRRSALGCHWHSAHPLTERISMLKRPLPHGLRRNIGLALTFAFVGLGSYALKAAQAEVPLTQAEGPLIALKFRWLFNGAEAPILIGRVPDVALLHNGATVHVGFNTRDNRGSYFECTVKSSNGTASSTGGDASGAFLISCKLFDQGEVIATPTVLTRDGQNAIMKSGTPAGIVITLELNASSSEARVAAAREAIESQEQIPLKDGEKKFFLLNAPPDQAPTKANPAPR